MSSKGASRHLAAIVGDNIRAARDEHGMTQHELALRIGGKVSNQTISDWERGVNRPNDSNLSRLALILGCDFAYFYTERDAA